VKAVVKIGTSSITSEAGHLDDAALGKLADDVADRKSTRLNSSHVP
jgi:glutamate 5-kinase